jgi:gamma-glutamyltranspeptidase/glutathione hydrolase
VAPAPVDAVVFTRPDPFTTPPTLQGTFGMSASTHWLATAAAQAVLERGGNAFDAAAAGAFVLHVVEPHLNGPGGDMTGVFATAGQPDKPVVLMGQGPTPAAATVEHYLAEGLDLVPGSGALAAAVPAAVEDRLGRTSFPGLSGGSTWSRGPGVGRWGGCPL